MLAAAGLSVRAQKPAAQAPVFRSTVEVVQLDVSVLDRSRQPVRGLTDKDFTVLEDGRPQPIVAFSAFELADDPAPAVGWMRDVEPDVTTNDLKDSRLFAIVLDDAMIPQDATFIRNARTVAASIIDKLGPEDLTAVLFTGDNRKSQDFTHDKSKLRAALDRFNPGLAGYRFGTDSSGVDVDGWFYLSSVRTLSNLADFLAAAPNRRKAVFYISPGVPVDPMAAAPRKAPRADDGGQAPMSAAIDMRDLQDKTQEIYRRAQQSNVAIYPIDPTGAGGMKAYLSTRLVPHTAEEIASLPDLIDRKISMMTDFVAQTASSTGGRPIMNTSDFEPGIAQAFQENSSYYLIGFEPANGASDGSRRRLDVKVNRPDVEVRARSSYYAPKPDAPAKSKTPVAPDIVELGKAIGGLLPAAGLPMRVSLAPLAVPGQRLATVTVVLGIRQPVPAAAASARVTETTELQMSAFTPEGDPKGTQRQTAHVVLRAGSGGEAAYEVLGRIDLPAGRYRLRLAASNATSAKSGSVFADVVVPDYSNVPVSAAPVMLSAAPGRASAPKDFLASLLPVVPTADRDFAATDRVTALLRIYQSGQKSVGAADIRIRLKDEQERVLAEETRTVAADRFAAIAQQPDTAASSAQTPILGAGGRGQMSRAPTAADATPDRFANLALRSADVRYQLPMSSLESGQYLLSFDATVGATTIRRDVRFSVRRP